MYIRNKFENGNLVTGDAEHSNFTCYDYIIIAIIR